MQTRFSELHDLLDRQVVPNALAALQSLIQKKNHPGITQRTRRRQAREHLAHRSSIAQLKHEQLHHQLKKSQTFNLKSEFWHGFLLSCDFFFQDLCEEGDSKYFRYFTFLRLRDCLTKKCCVLWIFLSSTGFRFLPQHSVWKSLKMSHF